MLRIPALISLLLFVGIWPFPQAAKNVEIKKSQLPIPAQIEPYKTIRVLLSRNLDIAKLRFAEGYVAFNGNGDVLEEYAKDVTVQVSPVDSKKIKLGSRDVNVFPLILESNGEGVSLNEKHFRDHIILWPTQSGKLMVINELSVEGYLRGVLPWEANPKWGIEALKAQAVASRTYAFFRIFERQYEKYDVSSDVLSQVYKGKSIEKESTNNAVSLTEGEVMTYRGNIFPAFFHSTSGGATTNAASVWNIQEHPSLRGVVSEFSRASKHYRWSNEFTEQQIIEALRKKQISVQRVDEMKLDKVDKSGRARYFEFKTDQGAFRVHSNEFRLAMGAFEFKSTKIESIKKVGDKFLMKGYGWGHGVGMCQYSAKRLAELGYTYRDILEFFYPRSKMMDLYGFSLKEGS